MKKLLASLCILTFAFAAMAQKPVIKFDKTTHDFGTMKEADGRVTTVFEFTNEGATPLVVSQVRASCGCTTPNWTKTPIEPGQKGNITVTYNPTGRQGGPWQKSITVTSNAETATMRLTIKGNTISKAAQPANNYPVKIGSVGLKSGSFQFNNIKKGSIVERSIEVANNSNENVTIELVSAEKYVEVIATPEVVEPGKTAILKARLNSQLCNIWGPVKGTAHLLINGSKERTSTNQLNIAGNIIEDFSTMTTAERQQAPIAEFSTRTIDLGVINADKTATTKVSISNKGKKALAIRRVVNNSANLKVTPSKNSINNGKKADLKIEVNTKGLKPSSYRRSITVITNDPDHTNTIITVVWRVE